MSERKRAWLKMGIPSTVAVQKTTLTPKAIVYQKFGANAHYRIEEIQESNHNECLGLAIVNKGPCLYRCHLKLPELSAVSETFKKKKDAEQSAAELALEKIGIDPKTYDPSLVEDPWHELANRLTHLFSNEFLSSLHPLSSQLKAVLRRQNELKGSIPISILVTYDTKINSLCKTINPKTESDPQLTINIILKAVSKLSDSIAISKDQLSVHKETLYPPEITQSIINLGPDSLKSVQVKAVRIPHLVEKMTVPLTLEVNPNSYYLDTIAQELESKHASTVVVSRTIGKTSAEVRLYFSLLEEGHHLERSLNARASYLVGHPIYGDAVLASIGYTWRSADLFYEDVSLTTYYRMLLNKIPGGIYKLSRDSVLVAELPGNFTAKNNWRGSYPRELLSIFCRQHHLSEPIFSPSSSHLKPSPGSPSHKKLHITEQENKEINGSKTVEAEETFKCNINILSKSEGVFIECSPKESFKKQNDAIQSAALKILLWLNFYFKRMNLPLEELASSGDAFDIIFCPEAFFKAFSLGVAVPTLKQSFKDMVGDFHIDGQGSGASPSNGYIVCISYSVSLVEEGEDRKELVESSEEFEFEVGTGAAIPSIEAVVAQMLVGQSAGFLLELPSKELILASSRDCLSILPLLSLGNCSLEYCITMLSMTEPMEERMEQALFSPPLSKQRVEFAVQHIRDSCATTLVDFGCGSGSLLESLLDYPTSLCKIVGVDISQKGLTRAAKMLHLKLSKSSNVTTPGMGVKSAQLFDGSILEYDSRLYGVDIGTCLEVIEHMEEHEANLFGNIVLSSFRPNILIVSTPNYEYNVIIQKSPFQTPTDESQPCKFRNLDHKFEWTREQFNVWASALAIKYSYDVEFGGVGKTADDDTEDLGYASQIAVFKRADGEILENVDMTQRYSTMWDWSSNQ